jgi:xanthine dehydrogenase accessory factor
MFDKFLEYAQELKSKNEPFVIAIVIWREPPSSSKVGDKALINKSGEILGWVGGGCVKSIIVREAEDALKTGRARLVKIGKSIESLKRDGVMEYEMTCQGEGTVEIFIEPVIRQRHLVVIGKSAIARSLSKLAHDAGYYITGVARDANLQTFEKVDELITQINLANVKTTPASCIVVATQGEYDEEALLESLKKERVYIGFVASRKKMASIADYLADTGFDRAAISTIRSPAGIDINARNPDEVAISILAEMIQVQNSSTVVVPYEKSGEPGSGTVISPRYYINPVCEVPVNMDNPKYVIEYRGEKVYFCCDGCRVKFESDPEKFMSKVNRH